LLEPDNLARVPASRASHRRDFLAALEAARRAAGCGNAKPMADLAVYCTTADELLKQGTLSSGDTESDTPP
jgi:hypothetical protein